MATNCLKPSLLFLCLAIATVFSVTDKTKNYCIVCNKCCQKNLESSRKSLPEDDVFKSCFGILPDRTGLLCSSCRRALYSYKATGKTFFYVSISQKQKTGKRNIRWFYSLTAFLILVGGI